MNDEGMKLVEFDKWCNKCVNKDTDHFEPPCNECLHEPTNQYSTKPVKFQPKYSQEKQSI